jgi:hypothetical protein
VVEGGFGNLDEESVDLTLLLRFRPSEEASALIDELTLDATNQWTPCQLCI